MVQRNTMFVQMHNFLFLSKLNNFIATENFQRWKLFKRTNYFG